MDGCIYRTKDGECDLYAEGGKFHAFCVGDEPCEGRRQTNYDRIVSKSPEELARLLASIVNCNECKIYSYKDGCMTNHTACVCQWLDWLKQEAGNEV